MSDSWRCQKQSWENSSAQAKTRCGLARVIYPWVLVVPPKLLLLLLLGVGVPKAVSKAARAA